MGHIPEALDVFFKDNELGIYIEEDVLTSDGFFNFQKELLPKFKNNTRIFGINGFNPFYKKQSNKYSYYLSQIGCIWGFGIYKRSWQLYDLKPYDYQKFFNNKKTQQFIFSKKYQLYIKQYIEAINKDKLKTWDIQINYAAFKNNMFFITPSINLVNNIGFFNKKTTSAFLSNYFEEVGKLNKIKHPSLLVYKKTNDLIFFDNLLKGGYLRIFLIKIYLYLPEFIKNLVKLLIKILK
jgi:hypothetical protein